MPGRRHDSLIPLSHQHHHGLVLSHHVQEELLENPLPAESITALAKEVVEFFGRDLVPHFAAEEEVLFPFMREHLGPLPIIDELLIEHQQMRSWVEQLGAQADAAPTTHLKLFADGLRDHIRKEERVLFPLVEERVPEEALIEMGNEIEKVLTSS